MEEFIMENFALERLLKRLPLKYHKAVEDFEEESGLIDNCKYMLYIKEDYTLIHGETSFPCKSISEAIYFMKYYSVI